MTKSLTDAEVQHLALQLDIDTPILAHRVVGDRIELHLLGGAVAQANLQQYFPTTPPAPSLDEMTLEELRQVAADKNLPGREAMNKKALLKALKEASS